MSFSGTRRRFLTMTQNACIEIRIKRVYTPRIKTLLLALSRRKAKHSLGQNFPFYYTETKFRRSLKEGNQIPSLPQFNSSFSSFLRSDPPPPLDSSAILRKGMYGFFVLISTRWVLIPTSLFFDWCRVLIGAAKSGKKNGE